MAVEIQRSEDMLKEETIGLLRRISCNWTDGDTFTEGKATKKSQFKEKFKSFV